MTGRRWALLAVGLASTGLAVAGVLLPGLPTTVFVLVAMAAFAQSSERLHAWLRRTPLLRQAVAEADRFRAEGGLTVRVKAIAQGFAWGSFVVVCLLIPSAAVGAPVLVAAVSCTVAMGCIPTRAPA